MTFAEAANATIPFGKHLGSRIDDVAKTDDGLRYLDWMRTCNIRSRRFSLALTTYMEDESIQRELAEAMAKGKR